MDSVINAILAAATVALAVVAAFQDRVRAWAYRPKFNVSIRTEPPDCHSVPFTDPQTGEHISDSIYLRLWIENNGSAPAKNAEVYAKGLRRKRREGVWEAVAEFSPMNLKWSHLGSIYLQAIAPDTGKHCDLGHIADPAQRHMLREDSPRVSLGKASLAFDLIVAPNHKGHIVGPGDYELDILIAAANAKPAHRTVEISIDGRWNPDEERMLRDFVGVRIKV